MTNKLLVARILRIVFVLTVIVWGILMWRALPEQIPVSFDASFLPDEYNVKKSFVWIFIFAFAALLPVPKQQTEEGDEDKNDVNNDKKPLIMNWVHTLFMSAIFIIIMVLVKKNLR